MSGVSGIAEEKSVAAPSGTAASNSVTPKGSYMLTELRTTTG
jgi:hypothetical protein